MSSRWESILSLAREVDEAFATGKAPETALVMLLARAVSDFQQHLAGMNGSLARVSRHRPIADAPPGPVDDVGDRSGREGHGHHGVHRHAG